MSLSNPLKQLRRLDMFSSEFHDQVSNILYGEEYRKWVKNLEGDDLMGIVEYLDKVRCRGSLLRSLLRSPQVLATLDPTSLAFRECLRELRMVCGARTILPASHVISSQGLIVGREPVAGGGYGDVYEGSLDGSKVCVKRARMYTKGSNMETIKVQRRRYHFPAYRS